MIAWAAGILLAVTVSGVQTLNSTSQPMRATLDAVAQGAPLLQHLTLREYGGGTAAPVRFFDRDMTKKLHLIVVDDGLHTFMHVHPQLQPDGAFEMTLRFTHPGMWHLYADGIPHNFGRQVFRFDLPLRGSEQNITRTPNITHIPNVMLSLSKHGATTITPYKVTLDRKTLPAGKLSMLQIHITKNGKPATDLRPYLGARAHAVVIGTDLSYIHAHAMKAMPMPATAAMSGMPMPEASAPSVVQSDDPCSEDADLGMSMVELPPASHVASDMMVMLKPAKPGRYFLWLQFRGGGRVYTAPFILTAV